MSSGRTSRIPSLDGLRAVSIALVLLGHLTGTRGFPQHIQFVGSYANFGVRVFFVISGYLITSLLLKERLKRGGIDLLEFYRRRAYRILPPAYLYMLLICIAEWSHLTAKNIVTAFTYTSNYFIASTPWRLGHLWSLSVEEQFYLLWPAVLVLAFARGRQIALGVILAAPVLRIVLYFAGAQYIEYYFPTVADAIATGCLLAIVWPELKRFDHILLSRFMIVAPIVTLAIPLLRGSGWENRLYQTVGVSVMHFGIAICIYNAICKSWRWLNHPIMIWVGLTSYSLYLWQQLFLDRADQVHWWTAFPQNLILAIAAATCSYYLVERPFLRLRDLRREVTVPVAASAVSAGSEL